MFIHLVPQDYKTDMWKSVRVWLVAVVLSGSTLLSGAATAETAKAGSDAGDLAYYGFEPDIITNYIKKGRDLGYIRLTAELMIEGNKNLEVVEHHAPLLRSAIVEIFGRQPEERIKSLAGREEIRRTCLEAVNALLEQETGVPLASDLLFTKYLYH